jgi:hypothetical protein
MRSFANSGIVKAVEALQSREPWAEAMQSPVCSGSTNTMQRRIVTWTALLLVGYFAILQISHWPQRLEYPGEEDAAEGTQLAEMVHLRQGIHIYRVPSQGEFDSAIYGPLSYLVGAAVINPSRPTYLPLRLLSLGATIALIVLGAVFVSKLTRQKMGGVLAAAILLSTAFISRYGVSARADMVALLLAFSGFVVFYNARESQRALVFAAVLMLLSFFYKQQFIGAPVAIFSYLVSTRRFQRAIEFAAFMGIGAGILVALFSLLIFSHQAFLLHFFSYNRLPFEKDYVLPEILMFAIPLFVPLLGTLDYVDRNPDKLLTWYAGTSLAAYFLFLLSSGSGADTNRCLEAAVVLSCIFAARIASSEKLVAGLAWTAALGVTLALVSLMSSAFVVRKITANDFVADTMLQSYLKANIPPRASVLAYYAGDPLRAGLNASVTNLWHYASLIRSGKISDRDIVSRIRSGGYTAILLDFDLARSDSGQSADFYTTESMRRAILTKYQLTARLDEPTPELTRYSDGHIYVWKPHEQDGGGSQK